MVPPIDSSSTSLPHIDAPLAWREFICDQCGRDIAQGELLLLREAYRMPEAPEFYVHEDCVALYLEQQEGIWNKMLILPDNKGWMLY